MYISATSVTIVLYSNFEGVRHIFDSATGGTYHRKGSSPVHNVTDYIHTRDIQRWLWTKFLTSLILPCSTEYVESRVAFSRDPINLVRRPE